MFISDNYEENIEDTWILGLISINPTYSLNELVAQIYNSKEQAIELIKQIQFIQAFEDIGNLQVNYMLLNMSLTDCVVSEVYLWPKFLIKSFILDSFYPCRNS